MVEASLAVCDVAICEPTNFEEAVMEEKWLTTITKFNIDGSINKNKERIVVKDYSQIFEIDYSYTFLFRVEECHTFAPVHKRGDKCSIWMSGQPSLIVFYKRKFMLSNQNVLLSMAKKTKLTC
ncbi:hypothetical protein CR513_14577, partial [Mucuna pruriens]